MPRLDRHVRLSQQPAGARAVLPVPGSAHAHEPAAGEHLRERPAGQRARDPLQLRGQHAGALVDRTRRMRLVRIHQRVSG